MNPKTDSELVKAIQSGDILAFEVLVKRYQRGLFVFVHRMLFNEDDAYEVVQDALFSVYRSIDKVDPDRKFSTYIFEIAKNAAISLLRKRKRTIPLEAIADLEDDKPFFENFLRSDRVAIVHKAVNALPKRYAEAISLYYFDDLSYEEISHALGMPINTVRTNIRRAKAVLKKELSYES